MIRLKDAMNTRPRSTPNRNENVGFIFKNYRVFGNKGLFKTINPKNQLQNLPEDLIYFIDVDPHEPTTDQIDQLRDEIQSLDSICKEIPQAGS